MTAVKITPKQIDAVLPQTQCEECNYKGCKPYAEAIAWENERIDLCPPGGLETLIQLAELKGIDATPYEKEVTEKTRAPSVAVIREAECIGCTKCIQACPVDAILGAPKAMHTVISHECTGCGLCVEPCPVDCIDLLDLNKPQYDRDIARKRFEFRNFRLQRLAQERDEKQNKPSEMIAKQNYIAAARARAKARKTSA